MKEFIEDIDQLLELDETALTVKLAESSKFKSKELLPFDPEAAYNYGVYLLKVYNLQVEEAVCKNEKIIEMLTINSDDKMIALEIIGILVSLKFQVSPVVLAVLLVKKGLSLYCKNYWGT